MAKIDLESVLTAMIGNRGDRGKSLLGRANFNLIRPVKADGGTEQSYAGLRVPRVAPGRASNINLTDPQTTYQRTQGDGIQTLGGYDGDAVTTEPQMTVAGEVISDPREKKDGNVKAAGLINGIGDIGSSIAQSFGNGRSPRESNLLAKYFGGFRANGGPVEKGKLYRVNEKGEEVFVPNHDGYIIPSPETIAAKGMPLTDDGLTSDPTTQTLGGYEGEQATEPPMTVAGEMISDPREQVSEVVTSDVSTPSVAEKLKAELDRRQNKDFKKGGKDRDKDHNVMDVIRSIGLGALKGIASGRGNSLESILGNALGGAAGGGIAGAMDASADEKMGNEMAIAKLQPQYAQAAKAEADARASKLAEQWRLQQIKNSESLERDRIADNERLAEELKRKIEKDAATVEYWNRKADQNDLKIAQDGELLALRDKWATSKNVNDKRRLDLVEKEILERTKRNDANIKARRQIAGMKTASTERMTQLRIEASKLRTELQEAEKNKRADKANEIRLRLKGIIDEVDGLTAPATGEAIID